jgi:peptidoglycan/LPS O-acetylase OafA/YrhL
MASDAQCYRSNSGRAGPKEKERSRSFAALDGWRGICAVLVALLHFPVAGALSSNALVANSHLFVDFFFVLSGFVLAHAYLDKLTSGAVAVQMIWRRLGRLLPLHLVILGLFVALEIAVTVAATVSGYNRGAASAFDPDSAAAASAIPTNMLLLHGLGMHDRLTWNEPSWSVSVEFWSAVVFAGVIVLARRRLMTLAVLITIASALIVISFSTKFMGVTYELGFFRCLYGFFTGLLAYQLMRSRPLDLPCPTVLETMVSLGVLGFVVFLGGTVLEFASPVVFAVCVWVFAFDKGRISGLLKCKPLQLAGLWSYSIYMVHSLVIGIGDRLNEFAAKKLFGMPSLVPASGTIALELVTIVYLAIVIGLSAVTWRWIEAPAQRIWNGRLWSGLSAMTAADGAGKGSDVRDVATGKV